MICGCEVLSRIPRLSQYLGLLLFISIRGSCAMRCRYKKGVSPVQGDRFAQKSRAKQYDERYLNRDDMFVALDTIAHAADSAAMTMLEAAIRWTQHHSAVDASRGDAVLIGVSRIEQLGPIMQACHRWAYDPA